MTMMPLVTENARRSFDAIVERAMHLRIKQQADDHLTFLTLGPIDANKTLDSQSTSDLIVVTIASITFRLLLILQIDDTPAARRYFSRDDAQRPFEDIVYELANLCGGVMNQEMLNHFPDLGMSTPYLLDAACLHHLDAFAPQYHQRFSIVISDDAGESVTVAATVCVSANAMLDFIAETDVHAVDSGGELEFF